MFAALDPVILARIQFGFTISFHFIFPSFSIGLASYLAVLEALWLRTGRDLYLDLFRYWLKIFAVAFAMGVVSGLVMSYQFGTNWSVFSTKAGPVIGPLMAYEVTIDAKGRFLPSGSWAEIIFNPSFPYRLVHTVIAAYLTTALVVGGVGAWHLLRNRANPYARKMFSMAMWMAALVAPVQIFAGDAHGLNTLAHQPAKIMAIEGHYDSHPDGAPLILFGIPNPAEKRMDDVIEIPKLSSLILKHDLNAPLAGLDTIPRDRQPPVEILFWSFRVMVGLGFTMLGLGVWSLVARARGRLYDWRWLHRAAVAMGPSGFVAVIAGWVTTEVGRQPYTVYGQLLTAQSHSPLAAPAVAASLVAFIVVYFAVFGAGIWYLLHLMRQVPRAGETAPPNAPVRTSGITPAAGLDPHMLPGI
jgi:cytochrome d ubiquinol oxidase subunit I